MLKALIINDPFMDTVVDNNLIPNDMDLDVLKIVSSKTENNIYVSEEKLFDFKHVSEVVTKYIESSQADLVCFPSTKYMKMISARVAIKLGIGLVADVIEVEKNCNDIYLSRPAFEEKIIAKIKSDSTPVMFTSRMLVSAKVDSRIDMEKLQIEGVEVRQVDIPYKIENYDLVFGCGIGFGNNYHLFEKLQKKLLFGIATTKKVTEKGWMEYSHQVGLSGKIIKPKIYIALGIEGAIHHIVGMQDSELIISVNINEKAAINSIADYYVNQDCVSFVEQLLDRLNS